MSKRKARPSSVRLPVLKTFARAADPGPPRIGPSARLSPLWGRLLLGAAGAVLMSIGCGGLLFTIKNSGPLGAFAVEAAIIGGGVRLVFASAYYEAFYSERTLPWQRTVIGAPPWAIDANADRLRDGAQDPRQPALFHQCRRCGSVADESARFCSTCGERLLVAHPLDDNVTPLRTS